MSDILLHFDLFIYFVSRYALTLERTLDQDDLLQCHISVLFVCFNKMKCKEIVGNKLFIDYSNFFLLVIVCFVCLFLTHIEDILFEFDLEEWPQCINNVH